MIRLRRWMAHPFDTEETEEVASAEELAEVPAEAPDYSFEGFSVEILDKVALLPVTAATPTAVAQSLRRRRLH